MDTILYVTVAVKVNHADDMEMEELIEDFNNNANYDFYDIDGIAIVNTEIRDVSLNSDL